MNLTMVEPPSCPQLCEHPAAMGKVGLKPKELARRERRQLWRDDAHTLTSEPTARQPIITVISRPHSCRAKKSGGRRKHSQMPDVLSPSKVKRIKDAREKKTPGETSTSVSTGLKSFNSITNLFDELRNLFGQSPNDIRAIADMKATYENLQARFPAGLLTPPNSSPDLNAQGGDGGLSFGTTLTISASSSSECEGSQKNPIQIVKDPFIATAVPLVVMDQSISKPLVVSSSGPVASAKAGSVPTAVAPVTPRAPREATSSLATPPATHHKKPPTPMNDTTCKRPGISSKLASARDSTATGKSDFTSKKLSTSKKSSVPQEAITRKAPAKVYTPESLTDARTAVATTVATLELVTPSPSVKLPGREKAHPKIRKLILKPVPSSPNHCAPQAKAIGSDTKLSSHGTVQQKTTHGTLTKSSSDVNKSILNSRTPAVLQKAPAVSISNKSSSVDCTPPKRSATLPTAHRVGFSARKMSVSRLSETGIQPISKVVDLATVSPLVNMSDDRQISSELSHKVPTPHLFPIPRHSTPATPQRPMLMSMVPAVSGRAQLNRTPLRSSSARNILALASSTTLRSSSLGHRVPARPPRVSLAVPVIHSRATSSLCQRSSAFRSPPLSRAASPAGSTYSSNMSLSDVVPSASTLAMRSPLIATFEIPDPESSTLSLPAKNTRDIDLSRRSNLLRMFKLRWTAGDDHLPFNVNTTGKLPGGDGQGGTPDNLDSDIKRGI